MYIFCLRTAIFSLFFLEGKSITIESVAFIQIKQLSGLATAGRALQLTHGNWELMTKCKQWRGANGGPFLANSLLWHVKREAGTSPAVGAWPSLAAGFLPVLLRVQRCLLFRNGLFVLASLTAPL